MLLSTRMLYFELMSSILNLWAVWQSACDNVRRQLCFETCFHRLHCLVVGPVARHIMVGGCVGGNSERQEAGQSGPQFLPLGGCAQWPNVIPSGQYSNDFTTLQKHQELKTKPSPQVPSRDVQNLCHSHRVIFPGTGTSPCQPACVSYCRECTKVRATALSKPKSHWPLPPMFPWEYKTLPQYFYAFPG